MRIKDLVESKKREQKRKQDIKTAKVAAGVAVGAAAIGAVGRLLFVPTSRRDTRKDIAETATKVKGNIKEKGMEIKESISNKVADTKEAISNYVESKKNNMEELSDDEDILESSSEILDEDNLN